MMMSQEERLALQSTPDLEGRLRAVEERLLGMSDALHRHDVHAVEGAAADLHAALATAVNHFSLAARAGGVPAPLRQRLALAGAQVAAQREALARATASLDRAIEVLMPPINQPGLYGSAGSTQRPIAAGGSLIA